MKQKSTLALIAIATFLSVALNAQPVSNTQLPTAEFVKILPTTQRGVIKVMHAQESEIPVSIKFFTREGEVGHDHVAKNKYEKGFTKKYDVSTIDGKEFWIEVNSSASSVTYRVVPNKDKKTFDAYLEKISYYHTVASNN